MLYIMDYWRMSDLYVLEKLMVRFADMINKLHSLFFLVKVLKLLLNFFWRFLSEFISQVVIKDVHYYFIGKR